jgi:hypothetical protein
VENTRSVVRRYQTDRLSEKDGPKTINDEVLLMLRLCRDRGNLIRAKLRPEKAMKLPPRHRRAAPTAPTRRRACSRKQRSYGARISTPPSLWI